jgi:hypothetical protein
MDAPQNTDDFRDFETWIIGLLNSTDSELVTYQTHHDRRKTEEQRRIDYNTCQLNGSKGNLHRAITLLGARGIPQCLLRLIIENRALLKESVKNSYVHDNGFDKIVLFAFPKLGFKISLHIWWTQYGEKHQHDQELRVHNHRWDFASVVLCGQILCQQFALSNNPCDLEMYEYRYFSPESQNFYKMECVGRARLQAVFDVLRNPAEPYTLLNSVLHRVTSDRSRVTATLVLQGSVVQQFTRVFAREPILDYKPIELQRFSVDEVAANLERLYACLVEEDV